MPISFLFYVGFSHNLVKEIWLVHMTLRSYKISCEIEGPVDFWSQLQGKCIFFLYRLIHNSVNSWPNHSKFSSVVVEKQKKDTEGLRNNVQYL